MSIRVSPLPVEQRLRALAGGGDGGGTEGNERLTAVNGALLIVLLAGEGVTIVFIGQLIAIHMFLGMLVLGPVALKMATTGYRFFSYYGGRPTYRGKGPPRLYLRLLAPAVVVSTVVMMASGVVLLADGPSARSTWLPIHKDSFFVWVALTGVHVLSHLERSLVSVREEVAASAVRGSLAGRRARTAALLGAVLLGVIVALLVIPDFSAWQHLPAHHHRG